jgi:hypothetical protein
MTKQIEWRPVVGFEGYYLVSSDGKIKSLYRTQKILKPKSDKDGYKACSLYSPDSKKPKHVRVHRIVAEAFLDNPNRLPVVNHIDSDVTNNSVSNLEWCTILHNNTHGVKKRTVKSLAHLSYEEILIAKEMYEAHTDYKSICKHLGLTCRPDKLGLLFGAQVLKGFSPITTDIRRYHPQMKFRQAEVNSHGN